MSRKRRKIRVNWLKGDALNYVPTMLRPREAI
jgi:hypothetical protein